MENKLPKGWVETELGDVLDIEMGQSPPSYSYNIEGIGTPFMQGKTEFGKTFPTIIKYTTEPKKIVEKGTVLLSVRAPIGPTNIANTQMCIGRGLAGLSSNKLPTNFILYYLRSIESVLDGLGTGTTFKAISGNKIHTVHFPLPPLPEQERIVAKLDKLFAQHEKIKKALDRIPQLLKAFRQQVLTQAVTGKLTEQWREGKDLEEWKNAKLGDICNMKAGRFVSASEISSEIENDFYPCYGGNGLRGYVKSYTHIGRYSLIGRQGALCGNVHLVEGKFHATEHALVVVPQSYIDDIWLFHKLTSLELINYSKGVAQPGLSVMNLNPILIAIPSIQEQQEIVRRVESLFAKADAIDARYQKLKEKIEAFPQAILHKAFKGELVPQLPTDGDARDLLKEIMALKEEVKGRKKK